MAEPVPDPPAPTVPLMGRMHAFTNPPRTWVNPLLVEGAMNPVTESTSESKEPPTDTQENNPSDSQGGAAENPSQSQEEGSASASAAASAPQAEKKESASSPEQKPDPKAPMASKIWGALST